MWNTPRKVASGVNNSVEARDCTKNPRNVSVELLRMTVEEKNECYNVHRNKWLGYACLYGFHRSRKSEGSAVCLLQSALELD